MSPGVSFDIQVPHPSLLGLLIHTGLACFLSEPQNTLFFLFYLVHQFISCLYQNWGALKRSKSLIKPSLKCEVLATFPIRSPGQSRQDKAGSTRRAVVRGLLSISEELYKGLYGFGVQAVGGAVYMIRTTRVLQSQKVHSWNPAWARPRDQSLEWMLT